MRELKFNVSGQNLDKDPDCDFSGLIMGSNNYVILDFIFSEDWKPYRKVIEFTSGDTDKFFELKGTGIVLPSEITSKPYFKIAIHGVMGKERFKTNSVIIRQERG